MKRSPELRRQIRAAENRRDILTVSAQKTKQQLAQTRALLKQLRSKSS